MAMSPELEKLYKDRLIARLEQEDADAAKSWAGEGNYTPAFNRAEAENLSYADLVKNWAGDDSGWGSPSGNSAVDESDPANAAFRNKFGAGEFDNVEIQNKALGNNLHFSYNKPTWFDEGSQDKSRIMQLDDGRWVWEANNLSGDYVKNKNAESDDSGFFHGDAMDVVKVAAIFAAAFGGAALLAGEGAATVGGGAELLGGTGGVSESAFMGEGLLAGGEGTAATTAGLTETVAPELTGPPSTGPVPAEPVPYEVPPNMQPVTPTTVPNLPPATTISPPAGWTPAAWNNLSPAAQRLILQGVSTGASAALNSRNASAAIDAANKRQDDAQKFQTDERTRRGQAPAAIATVRPRTLQGGYAASGGLADRYLNRPRGG
jgi:hypothetical protein